MAGRSGGRRMTREIPLGVRGKSGMVALVDEQDFEMLTSAARSWGFHKHKGYALGRVGGRLVWMHRVIMNPPKGMEVDHINGNKLDNRRSNLRLCTRAENAKNIGAPINNKTGYKGVWYVPRLKNKYVSAIGKDGHLRHLGCYPTPEAAAAAYNEAAKRLHGEFARLNVIPQTT